MLTHNSVTDNTAAGLISTAAATNVTPTPTAPTAPCKAYEGAVPTCIDNLGIGHCLSSNSNVLSPGSDCCVPPACGGVASPNNTTVSLDGKPLEGHAAHQPHHHHRITKPSGPPAVASTCHADVASLRFKCGQMLPTLSQQLMDTCRVNYSCTAALAQTDANVVNGSPTMAASIRGGMAGSRLFGYAVTEDSTMDGKKNPRACEPGDEFCRAGSMALSSNMEASGFSVVGNCLVSPRTDDLFVAGGGSFVDSSGGIDGMLFANMSFNRPISADDPLLCMRNYNKGE